MTRIIIQLHGMERAALGEFAEHERRDPRDQAAHIIRRELERRGYIQPQIEDVPHEHENNPT